MVEWASVSVEIADRAPGSWLSATWHRIGGIDTVDYVIAATVELLGVELLTRNVKHFPMIAGLSAPY